MPIHLEDLDVVSEAEGLRIIPISHRINLLALDIPIGLATDLTDGHRCGFGIVQ